MSTIIMMFILPLGIVIYFWDRRNYTQNLQLFRKYIDTISRSELSNAQKLDKIDEMFYHNGHRIVERSDLYYRFFKKPRILKIDLNAEPMLQEHA